MPEIQQVVLTLIYQDNTRFIVGGFESEAKALEWISNEQNSPNWVESTTWEIV